MRSFFKYVLATVTGLILTFLVFLLIGAIILGAMIGSATSDRATVVADNSVLHIRLDHEITERTVPNPFEELEIPGFTTKSLGLDDILDRIQGAKTDDRIEGILLDLSGVSAGFATLQEIRDALMDFKESDKFVLSYGETYTQKAYYLASTADKIYVNPEGLIDFRGLATQIPFLKGTLDKLGVEMQIVKVGTYKSAVEPFIQDRMSEANREQVDAYLSHIYRHFLSGISEGRGISVDSLHTIADEMLVRNANDAVQYGLADEVLYKDQLIALLKNELDIEEDEDINTVSLLKYAPEGATKRKAGVRDRIAVLYANGEISGGEGSETQIGSEKISRELRKLRNDERVKAVVFRINSPGGSALASDVIWREVDLLKKEKPVIVSMGDVAASGGYYIAAAADSIFAQPNTLTGSIGVFGTIPNLQELWNDKLGVTFDGVKTAKYADFMGGAFDRPMTAEEERIMQLEVNRIYNTFVKRVADGRNMSEDRVDSIGQGRVWSGEQALELGLVDRLGDIDDAIAAAAYAAELENYNLVKYPAIKGPFDMLLGTSKDKISTWLLQREFGAAYQHVSKLKTLLREPGVQARIPYDINVY